MHKLIVSFYVLYLIFIIWFGVMFEAFKNKEQMLHQGLAGQNVTLFKLSSDWDWAWAWDWGLGLGTGDGDGNWEWENGNGNREYPQCQVMTV